MTNQENITTDIRFSIIPHWLLESECSDRAIRIYGIIASYADAKTHTAFPSRERIAEDAGCHVKTVDRAVKELVDIGAITKTIRHTNDTYVSNLYTVHRVAPWMSLGSDTGVPRVAPPVSPGRDMGVPLTRTNELEPVELEPVNRKRALSKSWQPKESLYSEEKYSVLNIDSEAEAFRNWHEARGSRFVDWDAAFRNWLKKGLDFNVKKDYKELERERAKRELDAWVAEQMKEESE